MLQQPALDPQWAAVCVIHEAAQARFGQYAVAGDNHWNGIGAAGLTDRARRGAEMFCQCTITFGLAGRDFQQRLPYPVLIGRALRLKRKFEAEIRVGNIGLQLGADLQSQGCLRGKKKCLIGQKIDFCQILALSDDYPERRKAWRYELGRLSRPHPPQPYSKSCHFSLYRARNSLRF